MLRGQFSNFRMDLYKINEENTYKQVYIIVRVSFHGYVLFKTEFSIDVLLIAPCLLLLNRS